MSTFMLDYKFTTFFNEFNPRHRVWSYKDEKNDEPLPLITTEIDEIDEIDGRILLKGIVSPQKQNKGMASFVMKKITELADKHGVTIFLTPSPFGYIPNKLNKKQLIEWYKRNGFKGDGEGMTREPLTSTN